MDLAPIVIFCYQRPDHLRELINSLKKNTLYPESDLYIYVDGLRNRHDEKELKNVSLTRDLVMQEFGENPRAKIILRDENYGLARSITTGVTSIVQKYGKVIVLEDDLVLSEKFLAYMNSALEKYKDVDKVMHISGYWYDHPDNPKLDDFFLYRATSCWGWATWDNSWNYYNNDPHELLSSLKREGKTKVFNIDKNVSFLSHLEKNVSGEWCTWAIRWYASVFLQDGLCLHPSNSYVRNIGFDGTGENCIETQKYDITELNQCEHTPEIELKESAIAVDIVKKIFKPKLTIKRRAKNLIKEIIGYNNG
jgi:hypothetical protein